MLFISLFLPWFSTNENNPQATINGETGSLNAFQTYVSLDWLLVAACSARSSSPTSSSAATS